MATFKANVDQFLPDIREILDLSPKQIDALPTRNLGVEAKFFRCFAQGDKLVRANFSTRDAWNDRIQAPRCMFARKRSLVSCNVWCLGRMIGSFHNDASIDVMAGLQISQPARCRTGQ